jgi:hypothetical protein
MCVHRKTYSTYTHSVECVDPRCLELLERMARILVLLFCPRRTCARRCFFLFFFFFSLANEFASRLAFHPFQQPFFPWFLFVCLFNTCAFLSSGICACVCVSVPYAFACFVRILLVVFLSPFCSALFSFLWFFLLT